MKNTSVRIKICGLTREKDVRLAFELGAWALGFIFYKKSPRFVDPLKVKKMANNILVKKVGVFVDATIDEIIEVAEITGIDTAQLHGNENPRFCENLLARRPEMKIIKATRLHKRSQIAFMREFDRCEFHLVDSFVKDQQGGTGVIGDWALAKEVSGPLILSGGLNADNIQTALLDVNPYAVDVCSGVESAPGEKSEEKLRTFFNKAQGEKG